MKEQSALALLKETFQKYHIAVSLVTKKGLRQRRDTVDGEWTLLKEFPEVAARTLYKGANDYGVGFLYFLLPDVEEPTLVLLGPYLTDKLTEAEILELGERMGVSPKKQKYFAEYYAGIPVLSEGNPLLLLLDAFCEQIFETTAFAVVDLNRDLQVTPILFDGGEGKKEEEASLEIRAMEKRYAFENELMRAVSRGQLHKENELLSALSDRVFEKRLSDLLRNAKNYGIIMNTLLRKAAESGGVHPLYLDKVSSDFAARIEALPSLSENAALMREMFRGYCRLVRKHSLASLSPVVQKAVLLIDADISRDLTLSALAGETGVSAGYLSAVFKKEMGKTLTDYVKEKRMQKARKLLETTHLQIQTVAGHCGIMDVQYFSKMFKKETGMTPQEYRKEKNKKAGS